MEAAAGAGPAAEEEVDGEMAEAAIEMAGTSVRRCRSILSKSS
jgi:hypothetical protein